VPINPAQRIAKWDAKLKTDRIKAALDDERPNMYMNVQAVFPLLAAMELQVKQVPDGLGVSVAQYAMYLAFGRELWRITRNELSGESAAMEADVLLQKWVGRGMAQAVLEAISTQVFNIVAPAP